HGVRAARWRGRGDVLFSSRSRHMRALRDWSADWLFRSRKVRRCLGYRAHAQRDVVTLRGRERPRIKVALVDVAGIRGPVRHGTRSEERRVGKECRSRWEREQVAHSAVIELTEVAPNDHG